MPELPVILGWLLVGWFCGTPIPHLPPSPIHPPTPVDPSPWWQRWVVFGVLGAVGGVIGGYVFGQLFNVDYGAAAGILLTLAGSFVGARLVADIGGMAMPTRGSGAS
jgi:hypothetical protein